jgi:hypothetical protein
MTESVKGPDTEEQTGDLSMSRRGGRGGPSIGIVLIPIVVVLLFGSFFFLPISPTISGSLTIATTTTGVKLELSSVSYSRDPLFISISAGTGSIELPIRPLVAGSYTLTIQVSYGTSSPLVGTFPTVGDGTYGFKVRYILQQEAASTPYSITISVSGQAIQTVSTTFMVYPS